MDNVASTITNVMVLGHRMIELKMGDNIMVLKKGRADSLGNQTIALPPIPGDKRGVTLMLHETTMMGETDATNAILGIGVSKLYYITYTHSHTRTNARTRARAYAQAALNCKRIVCL